MPEVGEIKRGGELGYRDEGLYIYTPCVDCGVERWVELRKETPRRLRCVSCAARNRNRIGIDNPNWHGGRTVTARGYVYRRIYPDHPLYELAHRNGYVIESRLIMGEALLNLGLEPVEVMNLLRDRLIHHRNENTLDDRPENLQIRTRRQHLECHTDCLVGGRI